MLFAGDYPISLTGDKQFHHITTYIQKNFGASYSSSFEGNQQNRTTPHALCVVSLAGAGPFSLKYKDDEGDMVVCSNDDELNEAFRLEAAAAPVAIGDPAPAPPALTLYLFMEGLSAADGKAQAPTSTPATQDVEDDIVRVDTPEPDYKAPADKPPATQPNARFGTRLRAFCSRLLLVAFEL